MRVKSATLLKDINMQTWRFGGHWRASTRGSWEGLARCGIFSTQFPGKRRNPLISIR